MHQSLQQNVHSEQSWNIHCMLGWNILEIYTQNCVLWYVTKKKIEGKRKYKYHESQVIINCTIKNKFKYVLSEESCWSLKNIKYKQ